MLKYCPDKYKSQGMCKEAINACLPLLKFVPDWLVTNKGLKDIDNVVFLNDNIVFANADSDNVTFFSDDMGLVNANVNNVSLDDDNFDDDDPETIIHTRNEAKYSRVD